VGSSNNNDEGGRARQEVTGQGKNVCGGRKWIWDEIIINMSSEYRKGRKNKNSKESPLFPSHTQIVA
jgi:hypothetical protein